MFLLYMILGLFLLAFFYEFVIQMQLNKNWWREWKVKPFNFPFTYKGKILWYSRSIATALFVYCKDAEGNWYTLASKRGKGAADFQGFWCVTCGYLDFNETCEDCARRECREETGIRLLSSHSVKLMYVHDDPIDSNHQNVTIRYRCIIDNLLVEDIPPHITNKGEKDEVEEVKWIPLTDVDRYAWAFNHGTLIKKYAPKK